MVSSGEKGEQLEVAVHLIEETILKRFPGYSEAAFVRRRVIRVDDVRHEIDIWVEIAIADGYKPIFIFECKNWQAKIGKNEIIVFTEKIKAVGAQHGYFVATEYTSDAAAQAAEDPRMTLLTAQQAAGLGRVLEHLHFVGISNQQKSLNVFFDQRYQDAVARLVIAQAKVSLDGAPLDREAYATDWANALIQAYDSHLPSNRMDEGVYPVSLEDERVFLANQMLFDGIPVERVKLTVTFDLQVAWPRISSIYDVATRGRVAFLDPIKLAGADMHVTAVGLDNGPTSR